MIATDADEEENGEVLYSIKHASSDGSDLFGINTTSGEIYLKHSLLDAHVGVYMLYVQAQDQDRVPSSRR